MVPVVQGGGFVKDIVTLCQRCHFQTGMSHPVDIRPQQVWEIPLPLDGSGSVTCGTCHDPHAPPTAHIPYVPQPVLKKLSRILKGGGTFPTFFLRRPNPKGELCSLCHDLDSLGRGEDLAPEEGTGREYAGSATCGGCHPERFEEWRKTLHARTLRDPRRDPAFILGAFGEEVSISSGEVALALGGHWTQRYLVERGGRLMVSREIWSVADGKWAKPYWKEQDWEKLCAGCHLTAWNPYSRTFEERGIGCEACHGPGGAHADAEGKAPILNPARLSRDERDLICSSCHTHGHDRTGEYRYPVGYVPGRELARYYRGLIPKPGQDARTFKGDDTVADRLRSFRFWVDRYLLKQGVTCVLCKSFRAEDRVEEKGSGAPEMMTLAESCLVCHWRLREGDGRHSLFRLEESRCMRCHPALTDRSGRPSVHDHKFLFGGG